MLQSAERDYIRDIAKRISEIADSPENETIKQRWRDVNALRKPDRAPVCCNPVGCWSELLPEESLRCSDPWLRGIERGFRTALIKHDIGDDTPVESYYAVPVKIVCDPPNTWGVDIGKHRSGVAGGAWAYDPPLKTERDFDKLRMPHWSLDQNATEREIERHEDLLRGTMPLRPACNMPLSPTMGTDAADLRGLEQLLFDMAAAPELMHRLMSYIRDCNLKAIDEYEAMSVLTPNNTGVMFCADPIGTTKNRDGALFADQKKGSVPIFTCKNRWGGANSQEFEGVSPAMWEEFCLDYQKPVLERFGLTQYGCCENLTERIDAVLTIPNLRIFVCSAWTDLDKVIERAGDRYTIMWRQKASEVVFTEDIERIREHLMDGTRRLQGCYYQIVLRELQTLAGHMDRLHVWARTAIEAAENYA